MFIRHGRATWSKNTPCDTEHAFTSGTGRQSTLTIKQRAYDYGWPVAGCLPKLPDITPVLVSDVRLHDWAPQ